MDEPEIAELKEEIARLTSWWDLRGEGALLAHVKGMRDALEDMCYQFAYDTTRDGGPALSTGGLSALEEAFEALGWPDPYVVPNPTRCDAPVTPRCPNRTTCGTPGKDGVYKHFCHDHFACWQAEQA